VPLSAIATLRDGIEPRTLNRFQQLNAVKISGLAPRSLEAGLKVLEDSAAKNLPPGSSVALRRVGVRRFSSATVLGPRRRSVGLGPALRLPRRLLRRLRSPRPLRLRLHALPPHHLTRLPTKRPPKEVAF